MRSPTTAAIAPNAIYKTDTERLNPHSLAGLRSTAGNMRSNTANTTPPSARSGRFFVKPDTTCMIRSIKGFPAVIPRSNAAADAGVLNPTYTRIRGASRQRLHLDFAKPNLRILDLDGDLSPRQGNELPGLVGVGLLQRRQHIDGPSIKELGSPAARPNRL